MPPTPETFRGCLILTGPTGSGKSALAVELAEAIGAEIIAADSMTVYRGMDIGTAKPSPADRARVPHHLIDVLDPAESASVAWWLEAAAGAVSNIRARGRVPLFVGGTPLYLKALLFGLFEGPPVDAGVRKKWEMEADRIGPVALHARLAEIDPVSAGRLHPNDVRRVVRALEVYELTGKPLSSLQMQWSEEPADDPRVLCLDVPREVLYRRIDARVQEMVLAGWLDEVRRLRERPMSREAAFALGYQQLAAVLDGKMSHDEAIRAIQQASRQYAKRQLTWFRNWPGLKFVRPELTTIRAASRIEGSDARAPGAFGCVSDTVREPEAGQ
ncbi:MAG: tRNA (adenosine(37)-N6)-dimethylallyltransferase MiaA [Gemmataceae bacterium]|nr:tRNA (adenosine(37)-N6)-dimethylallyltransferase MiaA [Gemmataceae bacterium]